MKENDFSPLRKDWFINTFTETLTKRVLEINNTSQIKKEYDGENLEEIIIDINGIQPKVYIDDMYLMHTNGKTIESLVDMVIETIKCCINDDELNCDGFDELINPTDYENIKNKLFVKLINTERNRELLRDVPHKKFGDIAIVYGIYINSDDETRHKNLISTVVSNDMLKTYGINEEKICSDAFKNSEKILPPMSMPLNNTEYEGINLIDFDSKLKELENTGSQSEMFLLTNQVCTYGASTILYDGVAQKISNALRCGFYIIPSSVQEVLILPCDKRGDTIEQYTLSGIREINSNYIPDKDFLSNNLYYFDNIKKEFEII